jgi:hypothetical protein
MIERGFPSLLIDLVWAAISKVTRPSWVVRLALVGIIPLLLISRGVRLEKPLRYVLHMEEATPPTKLF